LLRERKEKVLERLQQRLAYETENTFYYCQNNGCPRHTFEEAMSNTFKCPICSGHLDHHDNTEIIRILKKQIELLKADLESE
jgi:transcription initiation factor TFIIE subunit alpha